MKEAGVSAIAMPCIWGGPELDPLTQIRVIEALAMADGSVGWCAMIGCDSGYATGFLDQEVARATYNDLLAPPVPPRRRPERYGECQAAIG